MLTLSRALARTCACVIALASAADAIAQDDQTRPYRQMRDAVFYLGADHVCHALCAQDDPAGRGAAYIRHHANAGQRVRVGERVDRSGGYVDIVYDLSPAIAADGEFVEGLELAASIWEAVLKDPITIVIAVGAVDGVNFIAATSTPNFSYPYESVRLAMVADAEYAERPLVDALPFPSIVFNTFNGPVASNDLDEFGGVVASPANAKALELPIPDGLQIDASIVFNQDFVFDSDPRDGITPGSIDTVMVMIHEIGHMLGFVSTVDGFFGDFRVLPSTLDLYRFHTGFQGTDPQTIDQFSQYAREIRMGFEATLDTVRSIAGFPEAPRFSTGTFIPPGDGRQASHWKDDVILGNLTYIGVMDPTYSAPEGPGGGIPETPLGTIPPYITRADRLAFSLMGWDLEIGCFGSDVNGDGVVDQGDLSIAIGFWATQTIEADVSRNGLVDAIDIATILSNWGPCE